MHRTVLAALLALGASAAAADEPVATLTMTGLGRVSAAPDMATIRLGVTAEAETAAAAMDEVSAGVAALLARLEAAGIAARDMQTSGLELGPRWGNRSSGAAEIEGYVAANTVSVRVRELAGLGGVLDGALEAGSNSWGGLSFGLQDPGPATDDARQLAVLDARAKAELYAEAAGVELGPILSISETGAAMPQPMFRMEAAFAADAVPVAAGELDVTASVTIVWRIED